MIVVIDTNALLPMLGRRHPHRAILRAWMAGRFVWAASGAILLEYEEIAVPLVGRERWSEFCDALDLAEELHGNFRRAEPSYRWRLIVADPDDDKFADCAIAAAAEWIVTEDAHFDVLKTAGHKARPITPKEFIARFLSGA